MKKKILIYGDHIKMATGYSTIIRNVFANLVEKYEIVQVGKGSDTNQETPFRVVGVPTNDLRGKATFDDVVFRFKPDIVIAIGDFWDTVIPIFSRFRKKYKLISYIAVDGEPLPKSIIYPQVGFINTEQIFANANLLVTYTTYGKDQINKLLSSQKQIRLIPPGFDETTFNPVTDIELTEFETAANLKKFKTIDLGRNFVRKAIYRTFQAISQIRNSVDLTHIQYSPIWEDNGRSWYLPDLAEMYNVKDIVHLPKRYDIGINQKDPKEFATLYNKCDLFVHPATREGFSMPTMEAMACALPVLVINYGPMLDYLPNQAAQTLKIKEYIPVEGISMLDALVDIDDFAAKIKWFHDNPEAAKEIGAANLEASKAYHWSSIIKQWDDLLDKVVPPKPTGMNGVIQI